MATAVTDPSDPSGSKRRRRRGRRDARTSVTSNGENGAPKAADETAVAVIEVTAPVAAPAPAPPDVDEFRDLLGQAVGLRLDAVSREFGGRDEMHVTALRNVKLGIIGFDTRYAIAPWHGFWIFDNDLVTVETYSAELNLAQPQEIELYGAVFDQLAAVASYGSEARAIILRVIDDLSDRTPENGS